MNNCVKINLEKIKYLNQVLGIDFTWDVFSGNYGASGKIKGLTEVIEKETRSTPYTWSFEYVFHFKDEESMTMFTMQYL